MVSNNNDLLLQMLPSCKTGLNSENRLYSHEKVQLNIPSICCKNNGFCYYKTQSALAQNVPVSNHSVISTCLQWKCSHLCILTVSLEKKKL